MKNLDLLEKKIGVKFNNKNHLRQVFVHKSYLNENKNVSSNERLEFLGDSVLSLAASKYLFEKFPELSEGIYTEIKSALVRAETLAEVAEKLRLGNWLLLSKGEEKEKGRKNPHILADCLEALIGAIFLDKGFEEAFKFCLKFILKEKTDYLIKNKLYLSPKTRLQELFVQKFKKNPIYKLIEEKGPDHKKTFTVGIFFGSVKPLATGSGPSKKKAEEEAAWKLLKNLKAL